MFFGMWFILHIFLNFYDDQTKTLGVYQNAQKNANFDHFNFLKPFSGLVMLTLVGTKIIL